MTRNIRRLLVALMIGAALSVGVAQQSGVAYQGTNPIQIADPTGGTGGGG